MIKWINKKRNKKGFTLVELVVVIAILGVLAAVAVPKLTGSRTKAANSAHDANVRTLEGAANMFIADKGVEVAAEKSPYTSAENGMENYVQSWPTVPTGGNVAAEPTVYTITIEKNGTVKVTPGLATITE